jgi:hypothetical protein
MTMENQTIKVPSECVCPANDWKGICRAPFHIGKEFDHNDFRDCDGNLITHNSILRYHNPNKPEKIWPPHTAFIKYGKCFVMADDEKRQMREVKRGSWDPSRFKIMQIGITRSELKDDE